jgi:hypothetical protein
MQFHRDLPIKRKPRMVNRRRSVRVKPTYEY